PDEEFQRVNRGISEVLQFGSAKDETDTQLGIPVAMTEFNARKIVVFGATGVRLDHLLANLFLPLDT
ncbi:MAG TPA: thiamine diphosphokinase, partial [Lactobacillus sp.]|nr:thiamine diphosphokinase [Lactobacillus sp.]